MRSFFACDALYDVTRGQPAFPFPTFRVPASRRRYGPSCFFACILFFQLPRSFHTSTNPSATHQQFRAFFRIRTGVERGKACANICTIRQNPAQVEYVFLLSGPRSRVVSFVLSLTATSVSAIFLSRSRSRSRYLEFGSRSILVFGFSDGSGKASRDGKFGALGLGETLAASWVPDLFGSGIAFQDGR